MFRSQKSLPEEPKPQHDNTNTWNYLHCEIYNCDIILYIGDQNRCIDNVEDFLKEKFKDDYKNIIDDLVHYIGSDENTSGDWCMSSFGKRNELTVIMVVSSLNSDIDSITTLSHECIHAAMFILNQCGVYDDKMGFESLAYLHEYIFSNFLKLKNN